MTDRRPVRIAPSILAADFATLAQDIERVRPQSDLLHVDIMDGHFVPNLTIGPPVVASIRKHTDLMLDCHLMVTEPSWMFGPLAEAGADGCSIHVELGDPADAIAAMRAVGLSPSISLVAANPQRPTPTARAAPPGLGDQGPGGVTAPLGPPWG